jgi:hypothetical protein
MLLFLVYLTDGVVFNLYFLQMKRQGGMMVRYMILFFL